MPLNYRPISLTGVPLKIIEYIIHPNVARFLESNSFFNAHQHGFLKCFLCESNLVTFVHDIQLNLDANIQTGIIFLDFAKVFDKVPHARQMLKLPKLNLDPLVITWIESFLHNHQQFVVANNCPTFTPVLSGVPQGSIFGPLLFLIFTNDLPSTVSSNIRLFADDRAIYRSVSK